MTVETSGYRWRLPEKIVGKSVCQQYPQVLGEWQLDHVYKLEREDPTEYCLCSHWIREVCVVVNTQNRNAAKIGNCCIKYFEKDSPAFSGMHNASDCIRRIHADASRAPNTGLIQQAFRRGVLNQWEVDFCKKTQKKRILTQSQKDKRAQINRKLILGICTSAQEALNQIRQDRTASANPRLIDKALEQRAIRDQDALFYKQNWGMPHDKLTQAQKRYKVSLNDRMIQQVTFQN